MALDCFQMFLAWVLLGRELAFLSSVAHLPGTEGIWDTAVGICIASQRLSPVTGNHRLCYLEGWIIITTDGWQVFLSVSA